MSAAPQASKLVGPDRRLLRAGWTFCSTQPDAALCPENLPDRGLDWRAVTLPCTVASILGQAGESMLESLDEQDHWFRCEFDGDGLVDGSTTLVCHGLATICEVWLNGVRIGESHNMFVRTDWSVGRLNSPHNVLVLCFRALAPRLEQRHPRARWRSQLVAARHLRFYRTTLLGRMTSWCPSIPPVGPWRPVELVTHPAAVLSCERVRLRPRLEGEEARLDVELELRGWDAAAGRSLFVDVEGIVGPLEVEERGEGRARAVGRICLPDVEPWWPHTHGAPRRYRVMLRSESQGTASDLELGRVGFRSIVLEGPPGPGFAIEVNGLPVFCRGTCWTPIDALALRTTPEKLRAALEQVRDAGMNMLRVAGTTLYEDDAFYALCDELGILVWQDFMFATFDYPADDGEFMASVRVEVDQFLDRTEHCACLAVFCGNSEGQQQPAMLGLAREVWSSPLFDRLLPDACAQRRPDVPYWPSTPGGGELPFFVDSGTSHYFGVGAYLRPLCDALLARPRFITECLAFANVPGAHGPDSTPPERIPRDRGASWDFKDVTDHYVSVVFGNEAASRASEDPELDATLARATSAALMQQVQSLWRDPASGCRGSLVWLHRDPWACAGWGVVAADGQPKSAYYGLRRAWAPVAVALLDDGVNGLRVQVHNDLEGRLTGELELVLMRVDGTRVGGWCGAIEVPARGSFRASVDSLVGGFVDSSYAYRFGPREFEVCVARLHASRGAELDLGARQSIEAVHLPWELGLLPKTSTQLTADWVDLKGEEAVLELRADHFVQCLSLDLRGGVPEDNFFHLAPGCERRIRVTETGARVEGRIRGLNAEEDIEIPRWPVVETVPAGRGADA
ncbi:MAG: beta-mannosidase [Deltaproteobacteria bacterium]|nr:beta-mannosidase [Deltaproteobacteria bacterium]